MIDFDADVCAIEAEFTVEGRELVAVVDPERGSPEPVGRKMLAIGKHSGISNEDYHKSRGESSSNIKPMRKSGERYQAERAGLIPRHETDAMRLGSAVHKLVLERLSFGAEYIVSRKFGRGAAEKEAKAEFYALHPGAVIITTDEYEKAKAMADKLLRYPEVEELDIFTDGEPEISCFYTDTETKILCKYRPDWENSWAMFDVKSCVDSSEDAFARTIIKFGYHISAAHYLVGQWILAGRPLDDEGEPVYKPFFFLCVESEFPYECAVYQLGARTLDLGLWERAKAMKSIKSGRESGEWPLLNNGEGRVIEAPNFAFYERDKADV